MSGHIMLKFFVLLTACFLHAIAVYGLEVNLTLASTSCSHTSDGQITVRLSGGAEKYMIKLYDRTPAVKQKSLEALSTSDTLIYFKNLPAKKYYVVVKDSKGQVVQKEATLASASPLTYVGFNVLNAPTSTDSKDGKVALNITGGTPPYSLIWNSKTTNKLIIDELGYGAYTCTVNDANNCGPLNPTILFTKPKNQ